MVDLSSLHVPSSQSMKIRTSYLSSSDFFLWKARSSLLKHFARELKIDYPLVFIWGGSALSMASSEASNPLCFLQDPDSFQ